MHDYSNRDSSKLAILILFLMMALALLSPNTLRAEGSADLNQYGAERHNLPFEGPFAFDGAGSEAELRLDLSSDVYVYAEAGEVLNIASSVNVDGWGFTEFHAPNGTSYRCALSARTDPIKIGFIEDLGQELAGPNAPGGYTPCTHTVQTGEDGVWKIEFINLVPDSGFSSGSGAQNIYQGLTEEWAQDPSVDPNRPNQDIRGQDTRERDVKAWDVTVSDSSLTTGGQAIDGRVFLTQYILLQQETSTRWVVQSRDGYTYNWYTNAQPFASPATENGNGLGGSGLVYSSRKGGHDASFNPIRRSFEGFPIDSLVQNPSLAAPADCADCWGNKLYLNSFDNAGIPLDVTHDVAVRNTRRTNAQNTNPGPSATNSTITSAGIGVSTTWLRNSVEIPPEFSNASFTGIEGTSAQAGQGMGGTISFDCQQSVGALATVCDDIGPGGRYMNIGVDWTNDGIIDALYTNVNLSTGSNQLSWDGTIDNNGGTILPAGSYNNATLYFQSDYGEMHTLVFGSDGERVINANGFTIERLNGIAPVPDPTVYWSDTDIQFRLNSSSPFASPLESADTGEDSSNGLHSFEQVGGESNQTAVFDTFAFVDFSQTFSFEVLAADLQVISIVTDAGATNVDTGDTVQYTITYTNAGPNDVTGATLFFEPDTTYFTNVQFVSCSATGTSTCNADTNGTITGNQYARTSVDIDNGDGIVLVITAEVVANALLPQAVNAVAQSNDIAGILRPADVFDTNATNPDSTAPTSVQAECESNTTVDPGTDYPGGSTTFGTDCNNADFVEVNVLKLPGEIAVAKDAITTDNDDGTYTVTFTFNVENTGGVDLFDVQVTDDFTPGIGALNTAATTNADLSAGEYYITSPLAITTPVSNASSVIAVNSGFNGDSDTNMLSLSSTINSRLIADDSFTMSMTVVLSPDIGGALTYLNQANASADLVENNAADGDVTDLSNDGLVPNAVDDTPTPIDIPRLTITKTINSGPTDNSDGTFTVVFNLNTVNDGLIDLFDLQITDNLVSAGFGAFNSTATANTDLAVGEYYLSAATVQNLTNTSTTSGLTLNTAYNGAANDMLLTLNTGDLLAVGDSVDHVITVTFRPNYGSLTATSYTNNVLVEADAVENGVTNGDTDDEGQVQALLPQVGVTKSATVAVCNEATDDFSTQFTINITNIGNTDLFNVFLNDDLTAAFGTYTASAPANPGEYTVSSVPVLTTSGGSSLTLNTDFDGDSESNLFDSSQLADILLVNGNAQVVFEVTFMPDIANQTYANTANGGGYLTADAGNIPTSVTPDTTDDSNDVTSTDSNDMTDVDPRDNNEPTLVTIPIIGVAKNLESVAPSTTINGVFDAVYTVVVENFGNATLFDLQLVDDMSGFGTYVAGAPTGIGTYTINSISLGASPVSTATTNPAINTLFNGDADQNMIDIATEGGELAPGEVFAIEYSVSYYYDWTETLGLTYENQVIASGDVAQNGVADGDTTDASVNDVDPDPDVNNNPKDNDIVTPTEVPQIAIGKQVVRTGLAVSGLYEIEYNIHLENTGNAIANNVAVTDQLTSIVTGRAYSTYVAGTPAAVGEYTIVTAPNIIIVNDADSMDTDLTANTGYDGDANIDLLDSSSTSTLGADDRVIISFVVGIFEPDFSDASSPNYVDPNTQQFDNQAQLSYSSPDESATIVVDSHTYDPADLLDPLATPDITEAFIRFRAPDLGISKTASARTASLGDIITWTMTFTNVDNFVATVFDVIDTLPVGVTYIPGSAFIDGNNVEPTINGSDLTWNIDASIIPLGIAPNDSMQIVISTTVTTAVTSGMLTNTVRAEFFGDPLGEPATATVKILDDILSSCAEIIGDVFANDMTTGQSKGVAGVKLYTELGLRIESDHKGKFHIPCINVNDTMGENFYLKLDERSMPMGYTIKSENPRIIRLTPGKQAAVEFELALDKVVSITLTDLNFSQGTSGYLSYESSEYFELLMLELMKEPAVLDVTIYSDLNDTELAQLRKTQVESMIRKMWRSIAKSPYKLRYTVNTAG